MSFDSKASLNENKNSTHTKSNTKTKSKTGTPVNFKFRDPIVAYPTYKQNKEVKKPKSLNKISDSFSTTIKDNAQSSGGRLKPDNNNSGVLMQKSYTTQNTPLTNKQSSIIAGETDFNSEKQYAASLPPRLSRSDHSQISIIDEQVSQQPEQQYEKIDKLPQIIQPNKNVENKGTNNLLFSPSTQQNNQSEQKADDRRFSVGIFADNQLPLSAVYEHNLIGSELGNEFSTLNEFLNLLDPNQQQLEVYNSLNIPLANSKNTQAQFNPMSPTNNWLNGDTNILSTTTNQLKGARSPPNFKEIPNSLDDRNSNSIHIMNPYNQNNNNGDSLQNQYPLYPDQQLQQQQQLTKEPDYRHHPHQRPTFQMNKFTKNYTRHNFPTLKNHQPSTPNQSSIYSGQINKSKIPQTRLIKRASYTVSAKEKFFLTAAAPSAVLHAKERLTEVIKAKLDAGLLKPYDYSKGYDRIHDFLTESGASMVNKQRIYKVLNDLRPEYVKITSKLKSVELVLVEESFEVMLLSLERVFSTIATPSCCWRRTGEIYRGNQEFATLAGCDIEDLRDGRLTIYELMDEESYCKYFELFGYSSLKSSQKSVLTHCNLKNRDVNCCFSFTIKRDEYNIPICIIGNFLPSE